MQLVKVLGLIPARGGSKGVPDKNIRPLVGKSLVQRAYECGINSRALDRIILSTDDVRIAEHARNSGIEVPFLRPPQFATDASPMIEVAIHALETLRATEAYMPDAVLLLQPTSPLRQTNQILRAIGLLREHDSVCSVVPLPKDLCPHYVMRVREDGYLDYFLPDGANYIRRQDVPQAYRRDGTIFLTRANVLLEQRSFYGARCVPLLTAASDSLNIDTPEDWIEAEQRLRAD